jgi:hypothetical protein
LATFTRVKIIYIKAKNKYFNKIVLKPAKITFKGFKILYMYLDTLLNKGLKIALK